MRIGRLTRRQTISTLASGAAVVSLTQCEREVVTVRREFAFAPGPPDNPMKGFVPFAGDWGDTFPHSMEWAYFPLSAVMTGAGEFDFGEKLEPVISEIEGRGHQVALRFYLDYPSKPSGVPGFLIEGGLRMTAYGEHGGGQSPDYEDENLISALIDFIRALGERYDSDDRVAYLTLGLLGFWGEWHTYPRSDLMASEPTQRRMLAAFSEAFPNTALLMRYPMPDVMSSPIGLHDDSFAHSTIGEEDWQFHPRILASGATDLWKSQPIGGEVRPEVQSFMWKDPADHPDDVPYQNFAECVRQTHASWMINQHLFSQRLSRSEYRRAVEGARMMGYDLFVSAVEFPETMKPGDEPMIALEIENRGVAPLYADWMAELELSDPQSGVVMTQRLPHSLGEILPGRPVRWEQRLSLLKDWPGNRWQLRLRGPRAFEGAPPLRFANAELESDGALFLADSAGLGR